MADALLSPSVGILFSAAAVVVGAKSIKEINVDKEETFNRVPLIGIAAAFVFAAQMINFTIPGTGSSGHLGGGLFLAILLGPYAGFLAMATILFIQAFIFADGGLLALGTNIINMGWISCFIVYPFIFTPIVKKWKSNRAMFVASIVGAVIALQLGSLNVVLQTLISGKAELPFGTFLMFMQPIHLAIGIVEGLVTAGLVIFIKNNMPQVFDSPVSFSGKKIQNGLLTFFVFTLLVAGVLSIFASSHPDGLEWSIEHVSGEHGLVEESSFLTKLQEFTSILPDYGVKESFVKLPENVGTSVAGITGSLITLLIMTLIIFAIVALKNIAKSRQSG